MRIIGTDMIPSLLDGWQTTQATIPLDLVPDTSGTAITADRYVPLATNAVGDWIEYLPPQPPDLFEVWYSSSGYYVSPEELRQALGAEELRQALEVHTPSGFGNDIERSYADEQWQAPLLSSAPIIPFTDDELEQLLQEE